MSKLGSLGTILGSSVSTMAGTRRVLDGVSTIGPDLAAAAFERASAALEITRRPGPGNTVVA